MMTGRQSGEYPDFTEGVDAEVELYRAHGMEPPWRRVWDDGVDVTDTDPSTWPWPYNPDKAPPRRNRRSR